ncbi:MAG: acyltransferase [Erysipelotrichaceae bacterium]|nr:acyltransferase [Erysipelotrichaceae bacterium]
MKKERKNRKIEYLRVLCFIGVLFYHLGILKGGYLAVNCFFVLSGYFTLSSLLNGKTKGGLSYLLKRLLKTWLPMVVCVFFSLFLFGIFKVPYPNLKKETASVLLGYNNFYQIAAKQDYFVRSEASPFLHMWYIAILLQYEVLSGLLFPLFRKLFHEKKPVSYILIVSLCAISYAVFVIDVFKGSIMNTYYGTFQRSFAFLAGVLLRMIHFDHRPLAGRNKKVEKSLFYADLMILLLCFVLIGSDSPLMSAMMLTAALLALRVIDHSTVLAGTKDPADPYVFLISSYSYEIYLLQYPLYYLFLNSPLPSFLQKLFTVLATFVLAVLMHNALDLRKIFRKRILNIVLCISFVLMSLFGLYRFLTEEDHSKELEELKEKLDENRELIEKRNEEYMKAMKERKEAYEALLKGSENKEEAVKEMLEKMPVTGIGDSVLINAADRLYELFPNGYFDGEVSRDLYAGKAILEEMKENGTLADTVLLCLSTNGDYIEARNEALMELMNGRQVFWIDAVGADDPEFNERFARFAQNYDDLHIIEWEKTSQGHPEYFWYDGIHITDEGVKALTDLIYQSVYDYYFNAYETMVEEAKNRSETEEEGRIAFYGDEVLIGLYEDLSSDFGQAFFSGREDYDSVSLTEDLKRRKEEGMLEKNLVFVFSKEAGLSAGDLKKLIRDLDGHRLFIIDLDGGLAVEGEDITLIDFAEVCKDHKEYLGIGGLSKEGNEALAETLKDTLK